ncbi:MAG: trigger factor [Acidimicrobiia bacterium]|jgi:trigger factor|nr:trigger factor [Acidimicrobiia bacterium]
MQCTVEPLEGNKVNVNISVDVTEFDRDVEIAYRKLAREVRIAGFRPGKAPRKVIDAHLGEAGMKAARAQAIEDAVPKYLAEAVKQHDIDIIATPKVDHVHGAEELGAPISFHCEMEIRPVITVAGYAGLRVELPATTATEKEIDDVVNNERKRHGTLVDAARPIATGDQVTVDLSAARDGTPVPGLNVEAWLYEVGRGWVAEGFDAQLVGMSAGEEAAFTAVPNGNTDEAQFSLKVVKVQELQLPELTDAWVADTFGEFDTVDAWRSALRERMSESRLNQARNSVVDRVTDELAKLVDIELPQPMVEGDLQSRVRNTVETFQRQGIAIAQFLQITGQTEEQFIEQLRDQSRKAVRVDLALRAIAKDRNIEVDDQAIEDEYERIAQRAGVKPARVKKLYEKNDAVGDLRAQLRKSAALEWLVREVTYVDETGATIATDMLLREGVNIDPASDTGVGVGGDDESNTGEDATSTVADEPKGD